MNRILTHFNLDLDAAACAWGCRRFVPGFAEAIIVFRPSSYRGEGMDSGDLAVDLDAGGRGIKGEYRGGVVHSAFATVISRYASPDDQQALRHIVRFIDAQDAYGSAVRHLAPEIGDSAADILGLTGLNSALRAFQSIHRIADKTDDYMVLERMFEIFDGMLEEGRKRLRVKLETAASGSRPSLTSVFNAWSAQRGISGEDRSALRQLVSFVEAQDGHGSSLKSLAPGIAPEAAETLGSIGIDAVLRALQAVHPDDATVSGRMCEIFDGRLKAGRARLRAEKAADAVEIRSDPSDPDSTRIAIVREGKEYGIDYVLFERGVRAVVYIEGKNIGVVNHHPQRFRVDHPIITAAVSRFDTTGMWFPHPGGHLYCCGSRKAPATVRTEVLDHQEEFFAAVLAAVVASNAAHA